MNKKLIVLLIVIIIALSFIIIGCTENSNEITGNASYFNFFKKMFSRWETKKCGSDDNGYCTKKECRPGFESIGQDKCKWRRTDCCVPIEIKKTCAQLSGRICLPSQICSGSWIDASDTDRCCSGECNLRAAYECEKKDTCNIDKISTRTGFNVQLFNYDNRKILYILPEGDISSEKALFIFPGTNGMACTFLLKAQLLIENALSRDFTVFIFQGECPYCKKRQFRLEKENNEDLEMVRYAINWANNNLNIENYYVYGFSEGAVFSLLVNDEFSEFQGVVADSGAHPDQVERKAGECIHEFKDTTINVRDDSRILLICGINDIGMFCNTAQNIYDQLKDKNEIKILKEEGGHTPHLTNRALQEIFYWTYYSN